MTLILVGTAMAVVRHAEYSDAGLTEDARLQGQARTIAENLRQQLEAANKALAGIRSDFQHTALTADFLATSTRRLKFLSDALPGWRTILIVDAQGKVQAADQDDLLGRDINGLEYFTAPRASPDEGMFYVSTPRKSLIDVYSINVGRALLGAHGEFAGVVTATLDPAYFDVVVRTVLYSGDMRTAIAHGDGVVFLVQPEVPQMMGVDLTRLGDAFIRHRKSGQITTTFSDIAPDTGMPQIGVWHTLQPPDLRMDKPLVIAVVRDAASIYRQWLRQTQLYAILFAVLSAGTCATLAWIHRRRDAQEEDAEISERVRRIGERNRTLSLANQLKMSEARRRESEQRLTLAAEATDLGFWVRNVESDEVWVSDTWRAIFGYGSDDPITLANSLERVHAEDRPAVAEALAVALREERSYELEFRIMRPDGQQRWLAARGRADRTGSDAPLVMRGVVLDITVRKQAELEVQQERRKVAHLARVTMLGELSGSLAHELNQPLTAILSNAQAGIRFLAREKVDLGEVREILQDIVEQDKLAGGVIRRLRGLLQKEESQRSPVDLNELVLDVARLLRNDLVSRGVRLTTNFAPDLPTVSVDRVQLQQVLINLVMNACRAVDSAAVRDRLVEVQTALIEGAKLRVSVIDRGRGIDPKILKRAFEPFFTTKAHGLGLGLSICLTIIKAHGGRMWCENNAERGAAFHFILPLPDSGELSA